MRKVFTLAIAIGTANMTASAQNLHKDSTIAEMQKSMYWAGEQLQKYKANTNGGFALQIGGAIFTGVGLQQNQTPLIVAGAGCAAIGMIITYLVAPAKIANAGIELKEGSMYIPISRRKSKKDF